MCVIDNVPGAAGAAFKLDILCISLINAHTYSRRLTSSRFTGGLLASCLALATHTHRHRVFINWYTEHLLAQPGVHTPDWHSLTCSLHHTQSVHSQLDSLSRHVTNSSHQRVCFMCLLCRHWRMQTSCYYDVMLCVVSRLRGSMRLAVYSWSDHTRTLVMLL